MTRIRPPLALVAALLLAALATTVPAHASVAPGVDSVAGVYSAIACGIGVKLGVLGGFANPGFLAITVLACAHMIIDAMNSPD